MVLTLATVSFRRIHGVSQTVWEVAPDNSTVWFALIIFTWGDPRSYAIPPYVCLESPAEFRSCLYRVAGELQSYLCCRFRADAHSWHCSWSRSTHGALHRLYALEGLTNRAGRISGSRAAGELPYYKAIQSTIPFLRGIQKVLSRLRPDTTAFQPR